MDAASWNTTTIEFLRSLVIGLKSNSTFSTVANEHPLTTINSTSQLSEITLPFFPNQPPSSRFSRKNSKLPLDPRLLTLPKETSKNDDAVGARHTTYRERERERERVASATTIIDPRWTRSRIPVQSSRRILHPGQAAVSLSLSPSPSPSLERVPTSAFERGRKRRRRRRRKRARREREMARARNETVPPFPTGKKLAAISPVDERCMFDDARNANRLSRSIIGGGCPRGT